jgi:SNF2 family DNA or RNA helicase
MFLLHDMGLGKTAIALSAARYPALVVVPKSAIRVWKLEAESAGLTVRILSGRKADTTLLTNDIDLFIVNYSNASYWVGHFKKLAVGPSLHTLIADEGHALQKRTLKWTQAFNSVHRELTLVLTATLIRNKLKSLWSLLNSINPRAWGSHYEFRIRYCGAVRGEYGLVDGDPTNVEELKARLSQVAIGKSWKDSSLSGLRPKLTRTVVHAKIDVDDRANMLQEAAEKALGSFGTAGPKGTQLKYLTAQRAALGKLKVEWLGKSGFLARKISYNRTIWWCWHKETAQLLKEVALLNGTMDIDLVTGATDSKKREAVLKEWQYGHPSDPRMLIATLGAMSSAVNLVTAEHAYFVELDYAPLNIIQAEKRHHRPGNKFSHVYASYIIIPGTIDARISNVLLDKVEESESVLGNAGQQDQIRVLIDGVPVAAEKDVLAGLAKRILEGQQ